MRTQEPAVLVEKIDDYICILLNNPEKHNALNDKVKSDLLQALTAAKNDDSVRAVLLSGVGESFCSGGDLSVLRQIDNPVVGKNHIRKVQEIVQLILELGKPVVAAVNGFAVGAGCNLSLACDVVFATPETKFSEIFSNIGLIPDGGGLFLLPRLVGISKAKDLVFTGRYVYGQEAKELGLVTYLVNEGELLDEAKSYMRRLTKKPPIALRYAKQILNRSLQLTLDDIFEHESSLQGICLMTEDFAEGVRAFYEKDQPIFKGK